MISINKKLVDTISKQLNSKTTSGYSDKNLYPIYVHSLTNLSDVTRQYSTYEMANWTSYVAMFCKSKTMPNNTKGYARGTIVLIELGAGNFGYEPSYKHPAIVLDQNKYYIMIAPCSSKKYGKGFPFIIDATVADGFSINTGVQTDSIRWVSKDRVCATFGAASSRVLDLIDASILKSIPTYIREMKKLNRLLNQLKADNKTLRNEIEMLKEDKKEIDL